jgi:hypothetical protein
MSSKLFIFAETKCERLRDKISYSAKSTSDERFSIYHTALGLRWRAVTRSRLALQKPNPLSRSILSHAVNVRRIIDPPISNDYFGNVVLIARTEPFTIEKLIAENALPRAAAAVRGSTRKATVQCVNGTMEWVSGTKIRA